MKKSHAYSPIDAVITWVDGNDPLHLKKRMSSMQVLPRKSDIPIAAGREEVRFQDNGELRYCLASIKKFAPWIRNIFIVTDNQVPSFLNFDLFLGMNIKVVDHKVLFKGYEWALPTFNSYSIETVMWRIPGIAPKIIYFNDDFLITSQVKPDDFFMDDKVVLRGSWKKLVKFNFFRTYFHKFINLLLKKTLNINRTMYLLAHMRGAELAGFDSKYFCSPHVPHPIRTQTLENFFSCNNNAFCNNIKYSFRDMNQFWPVSLANHLEISSGNALYLSTEDSVAIDGERDFSFIFKKKLKKVKSGRSKFLCYNSLERIDSTSRNELETYLMRLLDINTSLK